MANYTDARRAAYNAGIGYCYGKANKRMPVHDENKDSFREGNKKARKKLGKTVSTDKPKFSYKQKIEYYSGRIDDMSLRPGQRNHAVKRLQELAKK